MGGRSRQAPVLEGPFVLLEFAQGAPVVQQEHYRSTTTLTDVKGIRDYMETVDAIRGTTLYLADSAGLITKLGDELEHAL